MLDDNRIMVTEDGLIEITLPKDDSFLMVKETLTRIGIPSKRTDNPRKLYQSCHILHRRGRYFLCHFKELMSILDRLSVNYNDEDKARRDAIAKLLEEWGLVKIVSKHNVGDTPCRLKVVSFRDKGNWELVPKYDLGKVSYQMEDD